ncbi:MAG: hydroxymethylbilane synthase [Taibaiella sp.]|nr:hydroxymethylbilane synthase [Taibaiella sp.]
MNKPVRIGTRESQLAVWQATLVKNMLAAGGIKSELIFIKSDGDTDLTTPLYEIGVQGIFTKALDIALLHKEIDIAVHSMKDVPTMLAKGIMQAAVLPRASYKDLLVYRNDPVDFDRLKMPAAIATSSIRRKAQWLNRYPGSRIENLRGNVNTRLRKVAESDWHGAIFAAAGLERIGLRPNNAVELDWMLPAPAQGAIMIVCREGDDFISQTCFALNDSDTATCTMVEREFLRTLLGGCSTPISALATIAGNQLILKGNILSTDGRQKVDIAKTVTTSDFQTSGADAAEEILNNGGREIAAGIKNGT